MLLEHDEVIPAPEWLKLARRMLMSIPARTLREQDMLALAHRVLCAIEAEDLPVPAIHFPAGEPLSLVWRNERMRLGLTILILDEKTLSWVRHMPNGMNHYGIQTTSVYMVRQWVTWLFPRINSWDACTEAA